MQLKQEVTHMEEERVQVVNNIDELEQKIKELDNQMDESIREVVPCPHLVSVELALSQVESSSRPHFNRAEVLELDVLRYVVIVVSLTCKLHFG